MTERIRSRFQAGTTLLIGGLVSATPVGTTVAKGISTLLGWAGYRYGFRLEVS